jgi:hypothetical protein
MTSDANHEATPVETPVQEVTDREWTTPTLDEQSACAEICAYVFTA